MPTKIVLGLQHGDEGKGRIVDDLTQTWADVVVRFQGGANAGHTVYDADGKKFVTHMLPVGVLTPNVLSIISRGCVIDPVELFNEINTLDVQPTQLKISGFCPIVEPTHKIKDRIKYQKKLGTTARGIGPAYSSFYARDSILFKDLVLDFDRVFQALQDNFFELQEVRARDNKNDSSNSTWREDFKNFADYLQNLTDVADQFKPFLLENEDILQSLYCEGKNILLEGAQATGLSIYSNNYPDVTSSAPTVGGALNSTGLSHKQIDEVIGVIKAYKTKVGSGSFPSQIFDGQEITLAEVGCEYGATTGRPRKCGWLDLDEVSLAVRQNGVDHICIVKTDVMTHPHVNNPQYFYQNKTIHLPKINDVCIKDEGFKELISAVENATDVNMISFTTGPKRGEIVWKS